MSPAHLQSMRGAIGRCFALLVVLGAMALVVTQYRLNTRITNAGCLAQQGGESVASTSDTPSSITWELAGHAQKVVQQLRPEQATPSAGRPSMQTLVCVQARIRFLRDGYVVLDKRLFMPLYGLLSLLLGIWVLDHGGTAARISVGAMLLTTMSLLGLDAWENSEALALLRLTEGELLGAPDMALLDSGAHALRVASLGKWTASGVWATALAWGMWRARPEVNARWLRWLRLAVIGLFCIAAAAFAAGATWGWSSNAIDGPTKLLSTGMLVALATMVPLAVLLWRVNGNAQGGHSDCPSQNIAKQLMSPWQASLGENISRDFHMEEYRQIRAEVVGLLARIEAMFKASIVAASTVFALVGSNAVGLGEKAICLKLPYIFVVVGLLLPPVLVVCTGLAAFVSSLRVAELAGYLLKLEQALGVPSLGWESYLRGQPTRMRPLVAALWILLFVLTVVASMVGLLTVDPSMVGC